MNPTSGNNPYDFTASFNNRELINGAAYFTEFRTTTTVGSCPTIGSGANVTAAANSLLNTGAYSFTTSDVPAGSCRAFTLYIRETATNNIVESQTVTVSNV